VFECPDRGCITIHEKVLQRLAYVFCKEEEVMKEDLKALDRDPFTRVEEAKVDESDGE
jgi:hypothetical protein